MKIYKQILEAINKGILLALDNFDDDSIQALTHGKVKGTNITKEYINLMNEVVDLDLPSGTLWCKYNLGATCKPNNNESWYGDYYAWGETEPNKTNEDGEIYFRWKNYKFGNNYDKLTKYCNDLNFGLNGFTDNLTQLLPEDDVAYLNKKLGNFKFHIPTKEQIEELIKYTSNYWVRNYDPNKLIHNLKDDGGIQGLNGTIFEGKNKNLLFIPAAGYCGDYSISSDGSIWYIWTSSLSLHNNPCCAYRLYFNLDNIHIGYNLRYFGYSVRPVINLK